VVISLPITSPPDGLYIAIFCLQKFLEFLVVFFYHVHIIRDRVFNLRKPFKRLQFFASLNPVNLGKSLFILEPIPGKVYVAVITLAMDVLFVEIQIKPTIRGSDPMPSLARLPTLDQLSLPIIIIRDLLSASETDSSITKPDILTKYRPTLFLGLL